MSLIFSDLARSHAWKLSSVAQVLIGKGNILVLVVTSLVENEEENGDVCD